MRAIILREVGPIEALRLESVPDPAPGPGEVVVALEAAALNHRDVWIRKGMYAGIQFPAILGSDGAGTVVGRRRGVVPTLIGRSVVLESGPRLGRRRARPGAEIPRPGHARRRHICRDDPSARRRASVDRPAHLDAKGAAAIPLAGLTAYRAIVTRARLVAGETVLITGIGGGVSTLALQIAKALGARVIVTSRSREKLAHAEGLGADGGRGCQHQGLARRR